MSNLPNFYYTISDVTLISSTTHLEAIHNYSTDNVMPSNLVTIIM